MALSLFNQGVESADDLFGWGGPEITSVDVDDIDRVQLKSFERSVHALNNVFPRLSMVVGESVAIPEVQFGGDDIVLLTN